MTSSPLGVKPAAKISSTVSRVSPRHKVLVSVRHCHRSAVAVSSTGRASEGLVVVRHQSQARYSTVGPQGAVSGSSWTTAAVVGETVVATAAVAGETAVAEPREASDTAASTRRAVWSMVRTHQSINVTGPFIGAGAGPGGGCCGGFTHMDGSVVLGKRSAVSAMHPPPEWGQLPPLASAGPRLQLPVGVPPPASELYLAPQSHLN
ncbi:hypothetical protein ABZ726_29125 [Streptomyces hundungensis]|uniref:hypothetical protein n=1 Tax=Streptomyces hundungensis TaxID=1077946 RepID=UPI00340EA4F8